MAALSKRATIYFDPAVHQALKVRAASNQQSVSEIIDDAVRLLLSEDREDLEAHAERMGEPEVTYEVLLEGLKKDGKI